MFNDTHRNNLFARRPVCRASCYTGSFAASVNYEYDFTISLWLEFGSGLIIGTTPSSSKCCPCRIHPTRSGNKYTRSGDTVNISLNYFTQHRHARKRLGQSLYIFLIAFFVAFALHLRDLPFEVSVRRLHAVRGYRIAV